MSLLISLFLCSSASAVPMELSHSGRLFDAIGLPLAGSHTLHVTLYSDTVGTVVWSDDLLTTLDNGYFAITLGAGASLDDSVFDGADRWIALAIDTGPELGLQPVQSVPYAIRAGTATNLSGGRVDASELVVGGTTIVDSSGIMVATGTLGSLSCANPGEVATYNGGGWECAAPNWDNLSQLPAGFADQVDNDTLAALPCSNDQLAGWDAVSVAWVCRADRVLNETEVDALVENNGYALDLDISTVGYSGSWSDLKGVPGDLLDGDDNTQLTDAQVDAFVTNGALDFASGSMVAGALISTGPHTAANALQAADGTPTDVVYVDNTGNVGVGTTTPAATLDVVGDLAYTGVLSHDGYDHRYDYPFHRVSHNQYGTITGAVRDNWNNNTGVRWSVYRVIANNVPWASRDAEEQEILTAMGMSGKRYFQPEIVVAKLEWDTALSWVSFPLQIWAPTTVTYGSYCKSLSGSPLDRYWATGMTTSWGLCGSYGGPYSPGTYIHAHPDAAGAGSALVIWPAVVAGRFPLDRAAPKWGYWRYQDL